MAANPPTPHPMPSEETTPSQSQPPQTQPQGLPQQQQQQQQESLTQIYHGISTYPFTQDAEYQSGLAAILGHAATPATAEEVEQHAELVLQVQCFYFARKFNVPVVVEPGGYAAWLRETGREEQEQEISRERQQDTAVPSSSSETETLPPAVPAVAASTAQPHTHTQTATAPAPPLATDDQQPPYPNSFAAIVDLITRNMPVPGIEEIPTTVLEHGSSKVDKTPRRRKPWEKDDDEDDEDEQQEEQEGGRGEGTGEGVTLSTKDGVLDKNGADGGGGGGNKDADGSNDDDDMKDTNKATASGNAVDINGHRETGTGVVNILKPNAVPDSGLLSKD